MTSPSPCDHVNFSQSILLPGGSHGVPRFHICTLRRYVGAVYTPYPTALVVLSTGQTYTPIVCSLRLGSLAFSELATQGSYVLMPPWPNQFRLPQLPGDALEVLDLGAS